MLLAHDLARAIDPALIASDVGVTADDWQAELLRSTSHYVLILAARQVGKSTIVALIALFTALYFPNSLILVLSPSQRQSAEMVRTISGMHSKLKDAPRLDSDNVLKIEFSNGSRIIALPGTERTVRGYPGVNLVILDEASRIDDTLVAAIRPMLATSNGRLIALSTPAGRRGFFHAAWTSDSDSWERVKITTDMCPRLTAEFLAEELRELGPSIFSQEYGLEFVDDSAQMFLSSIALCRKATEDKPGIRSSSVTKR